MFKSQSVAAEESSLRDLEMEQRERLAVVSSQVVAKGNAQTLNIACFQPMKHIPQNSDAAGCVTTTTQDSAVIKTKMNLVPKKKTAKH